MAAPVTNDILLERIDRLRDDVGEVKTQLGSINGTVFANTRHAAICEERWKLHGKEHGDLQDKRGSTVADVGAYLVGLGALVAAFLRGGP